MLKAIISDLFEVISEDTSLTEEYFYEHPGDFPVFSGQTQDFGIVARIDTFKQDGPCVTLTTYGSAGTLAYREGRFTVGRNCMGLKLKKEYESQVNLRWFAYALQGLFKRLTIGESGGQTSLNKTIVERVQIELPSIEVQERQLEKYIRAQSLLDTIVTLKAELESLIESEMV